MMALARQGTVTTFAKVRAVIMAKRINIELSDEVAALLTRVAKQQQTTRTEVVRRALAVVKAAERQRGRGLEHFGFTKDPSKLDVEVVGLFD